MCSAHLVNGGGGTEFASLELIVSILVKEIFKISLMNDVCGLATYILYGILRSGCLHSVFVNN